MLVTVLTFLFFIAAIVYFAIRKKQSKLKEYEITPQSTEIKHVIAEVDPITFDEEPIAESILKPVVEKKPNKTATKKTATKTSATKKTTAKKIKKDGK